MTEIDRSPSRTASTLSVVAALVATAMNGIGSAYGLAVGVLGVVVLTVGASRGSRRLVALGCTALFAGALVSGILGAPAIPLLLGVVAAVLAWDFAEQAINVGEHLGRDATTRRAELVHAGGSTLVGVIAAVVVYAIYRIATGGQPLAALVFLLLAAIVLTSALRT